VWYGQSPLSLFLLPASWLYGFIAALRRSLYRLGWLQPDDLPVPVVVVGNITVGGTGKTPVVVWLAAELGRRGYRIGIVSRGYGGSISHQPHVVKADDDPRLVGDEPLLLAQLTGVPVCVSSDRVAAVRLAYQEGADLVLSDDGLQHYPMERNFEIAVVDGSRGLGNQRLLPAGPLREPPQRLEAVDVVLINGDNSVFAADGSMLQFSLRQLHAYNLVTSAEVPVSNLAGQKVWSLAGIGNPERFHTALEAAGLSIDRVDVPDHGTVDLASLQVERQQAIVMTQKDAVKYPDFNVDCWCVPAQLVMEDGASEQLLSRIEDAVRRENRS